MILLYLPKLVQNAHCISPSLSLSLYVPLSMFLSLSLYLSILIYLSMYLSLSISIYLSLYLSLSLSLSLSISILIYLSMYLSQAIIIIWIHGIINIVFEFYGNSSLHLLTCILHSPYFYLSLCFSISICPFVPLSLPPFLSIIFCAKQVHSYFFRFLSS